MRRRPEDEAREQTDQSRGGIGGAIQDSDTAETQRAGGLALRKFLFRQDYGGADCLLHVEGGLGGD